MTHIRTYIHGIHILLIEIDTGVAAAQTWGVLHLLLELDLRHLLSGGQEVD